MKKNLNQTKGLILVISGPSGSGKTTILKKFLSIGNLKKRLLRPISFTTRPKRPGERENKDYFFISEEEFKDKVKAKKILEWTRYLGYYYGTPKDYIEKQIEQGNNIALCLDFKGALKIKQLYPENTLTIFVMPPSIEALKERIEKRCKKMKEKEIMQRLRLARRELKACRKYDYCLVNKDLDSTVGELKSIVFKRDG